MNRDQLTIEVKSPVVHNNDLIGRIINKALIDGGFQYVENYDQRGDPVKARPLITMLDAVRHLSPGTFKEPVSIWTTRPADTAFTIEEELGIVEVDEEEVESEA